ncbi:MAG: DUF896 domain-containing protein [Clostridia bacterium]|nr:DUF896 domain-containing protein [Clostridia bacterium]MBR0026033.1 DUF896 domain-containing protein [Clostridia bacterium]
MENSKLERINALARKAKAEGLTPEEEQERAALRQEYIAEFRQSLVSQLDNIYILDENGNEKKLERKLH